MSPFSRFFSFPVPLSVGRCLRARKIFVPRFTTKILIFVAIRKNIFLVRPKLFRTVSLSSNKKTFVSRRTGYLFFLLKKKKLCRGQQGHNLVAPSSKIQLFYYFSRQRKNRFSLPPENMTENFLFGRRCNFFLWGNGDAWGLEFCFLSRNRSENKIFAIKKLDFCVR